MCKSIILGDIDACLYDISAMLQLKTLIIFHIRCLLSKFINVCSSSKIDNNNIFQTKTLKLICDVHN